MPSLIVRNLSGPFGFNNNRPARRSDVRSRAIDSGNVGQTSGKATPSGAPPPQGGMPLIALPFLAAAAAAPIYGYNKCQQEIAAARKKYAEQLEAAGASAPVAPKATPKKA